MVTLDMRFIRYLNLFERITRTITKNCFFYNNTVIFAVPFSLVSRSLGEGRRNVRIMSEILGKRVRIIALPNGNVQEFISEVIFPVRFKSIEVNEREIVINAGRQSKAALIGRNKARLEEINNIAKEYFNREVRII
jgi:NusA-like KH domain protein